MSEKPPELSYFALVQHSQLTDADVLTYWYRSPRGKREGQILPWPPRRNGFMKLLRSDVPAGLSREPRTADDIRIPSERQQWVNEWFAERRLMQRDAILEIERDPVEAAARFASIKANCCCCGKAMWDEHSVVYGIGPECRQGMSPDRLTAISAAVARLRAGTEAS